MTNGEIIVRIGDTLVDACVALPNVRQMQLLPCGDVLTTSVLSCVQGNK